MLANSPRVITTEQLVNVARHAIFDTPYFTEECMVWYTSLEPNSVHVIDHYIMITTGVKCKILCRHIDSDEAHAHNVQLTHDQFNKLSTADEFAAQLQRESEIDE